MPFIINQETLSNFQKKNIKNGDSTISFEDIFTYINNNIVNEVLKKIMLFIDLGRGDNNKYSNLKIKNSLFINRCISNNNSLKNLMNQNYEHLKYYYVTSNSFNPNYSKKGKVDRDRFKLISRYFNYSHKYTFNKNGVILLMFNNLRGCFSSYYVNFFEKLY